MSRTEETVVAGGTDRRCGARAVAVVALTVLALAAASCQQMHTTPLGGLNPLYRDPDLAPLTFPPGVTPPPGTTPVQPPVVTDEAEARFSEFLDAAAAKVNAAKDFHCILVRRELIDGKLQPEETLDFTQRFHPHSLKLEWTGERFRGRKMAYVAGANDDKVQVRLPGIGRLKLLNFALDSALLKPYSRYTPDVAGYDGLVRRMARMRDEATSSAKLSVKMGTPTVVSGRRVQRFDLVFRGGLVGVDASALTVWFDLDTSLVARTVMVDTAGRMVEDYDWRDIRLDTGLTDDDFRI